MKIIIRSGLIALSLILCSCTMFKPAREGIVENYTAGQFSQSSGQIPQQTQWWEAFGSEQLNWLMNDTFAGNLTLEQAAARLEQAAAAARKSGAAGKVQLNAGASSSSKHYAYGDADHTTTPDTTLGLYASYEVDLWGRIKSTEKAALANWESSKFDLQTAAMTISATLAQTYFKWQVQNETLTIYESQLVSNSNKLESLEMRYRTGQATSLAVLQQRQQTAAAEARIPPARALLSTYANSIAVLTGKIPGTNLGLAPAPLPALPPRPAAGLPVHLLENRPDIQAARHSLESADWSVAAARAARLPSLSLTGSIATSDEKIDRLFDDWISNLAASLAAPLLDGGSRRAEVDRTLAVSREKIAAYRLAVLEAVQETEDALSDELYQAEYVEAIRKQYDAAKNSETESIRRYQRGILSYTDTLTTIVARESLEITHVQAQADLLADRIQLYRALGGDWTFMLEKKQ
ncbi:MAG: efflux transporter outer membrane subunit [Kiritimatiellales bacterium]|nr:efflux transporter outer membrane subunit [Kiritimatiellales bacterium]